MTASSTASWRRTTRAANIPEQTADQPERDSAFRLAADWLNEATSHGRLWPQAVGTGAPGAIAATPARLLRRLIGARLAAQAPAFARTAARMAQSPALAPAIETALAAEPPACWSASAALLLPAPARPILIALSALEVALGPHADEALRAALNHSNADAFLNLLDSSALPPFIEDFARLAQDAPERIGEILDQLSEGRLPFTIDWREDAATRAARQSAARLVALAIVALAFAMIAAAGLVIAAPWVPVPLLAMLAILTGLVLQWRRS